MNNQLVKSHKIKYTPGKPGTPGDPGSPYQPGRWATGYVKKKIILPWMEFVKRFIQGSETYDRFGYRTIDASGQDVVLEYNSSGDLIIGASSQRKIVNWERTIYPNAKYYVSTGEIPLYYTVEAFLKNYKNWVFQFDYPQNSEEFVASTLRFNTGYADKTVEIRAAMESIATGHKAGLVWIEGYKGHTIDRSPVIIKDKPGIFVELWANEPYSYWVPPSPAIPPKAPTPAVKSQTLYDFNLGWNAGARSIDAIEGLGEFEFKVSHGVAGAVVGITGKDPDAGTKRISHAVFFNGPIAYAMTYGVAGKPLGSNQSDTVWKIKRSIAGDVVVLRNSVEVHAFTEKSFGTVFLDTSLYSGGDFVYDPVAIFTGEGGGDVGPITVSGEIVDELLMASGELVLPKLQAIGSEDQYCFADISLPNLVTGTWTSRGYAKLPWLRSGADYSTGDLELPRMKVASWGLENLPEGIPLVFPIGLEPHHRVAVALASFSLSAYGADREYSVANFELPGLSVSGESGYAVPEHAVGGAWLQGLSVTGNVLVGTVGEGGATLSLAAIGSDYAYGFGSATLAPFSVMSEGGAVDEVHITATAIEFSRIHAQVEELIAYLISRASATASMQLTSILTVEVSEKAEAKDVLVAIAELLAEMLAYAYGVTPLPEPEAEAFAWAATEQGGMVTRYSGYNFQSFAEINGKHYGVRADGLFLLEGEDDADVPITAELNFGNMNFSRSELKHLPNVYVGAKATDGRLFLKVETAQGEFTYEARRTDERMATQRFDLGRGLRDNWFEFTLVAEDVTAFELDNVEFKPVTSKRRI